MKVKPTGYRVLVKLVKVKPLSEIIATPDREQDRQQKGAQFSRIIEIGPNADIDEDIGVGDLIVTMRYPGGQFSYHHDDWKLYRIINDDEIIAKVEDAEEGDLPT